MGRNRLVVMLSLLFLASFPPLPVAGQGTAGKGGSPKSAPPSYSWPDTDREARITTRELDKLSKNTAGMAYGYIARQVTLDSRFFLLKDSWLRTTYLCSSDDGRVIKKLVGEAILSATGLRYACSADGKALEIRDSVDSRLLFSREFALGSIRACSPIGYEDFLVLAKGPNGFSLSRISKGAASYEASEVCTVPIRDETLNYPFLISASPAGDRALVCHSKGIAVVDIAKRAVTGEASIPKSLDPKAMLADLLRGGIGINSVEVDQGGGRALVSWADGIGLFDLATAKFTQKYSDMKENVRVMSVFSGDGRKAYVASSSPSGGQRLEAWDLEKWPSRTELAPGLYGKLGSGYTLGLALAPDGTLLVSTVGAVAKVDPATGGFTTLVESRRLGFFGPDKGKAYFASGRSLHLVDLAQRRTVRTFRASSPIAHVGMNASSTLLTALATDGSISLLDATSLSVMDEYRVPDGLSATSASCSRDGTTLLVDYITMGFDQPSLSIVDVKTKSELLRFKSQQSWASWIEGTDVVRIGYYETGYVAKEKYYSVPQRSFVKPIEGKSEGGREGAASLERDGIAYTFEKGPGLRLLRGGDTLADIIAFEDGSVLTVAEDGYFDYSGGNRVPSEKVYLVRGVRVYSLDQFSDRFFRPGIIAERIRGGAAAGAAAADIRKGFATPPLLSMYAKGKNGAYLPIGVESGSPGPLASAVSTDGLLAADGRVTVRLEARDSGGGIDGLALFVGNKAVGDETRGIDVRAAAGGVLVREYAVALAEGENQLRAVAFSSDRTESPPVAARLVYAAPKPPRPVMYVVAVASDSYRNPKYNLDYAVADAKGLVSALRSSAGKLFEKVEVATLYDSAVQAEALRRALGSVAATAKADDVFVFFYAGHGIAVEGRGAGDFYFVLPQVTAMSDDANVAAGGISSTELRGLLSAVPATKQLVLVDACNSGALARGFSSRGIGEEMALRQLARSSGSAVLTATDDRQAASEIAQLGHGVFTYALVQGLQGSAATQDGRITATTLRAWVDSSVPELSEKYRGTVQYPTTFMFGQDFPIGLRY